MPADDPRNDPRAVGEQAWSGAPRPRTVLVLGAGGTRALAHIGVLRGMERLGLEVDEVVATGTGALVGALFATGKDSHEIEEIAREAFATGAFRGNVLQLAVRGMRDAAATRGRALREFLERHLPPGWPWELDRPFFCSGLSLSSGRLQYFGLEGGPEVGLAEAVYAAGCLPGLLEPIRLAGEDYVSGALSENLGLELAVARRGRLLIVSDLSSRDPHHPTPVGPAFAEQLVRAYEVLVTSQNQHILHRYADRNLVVLRPPVAHGGLLDAAGVAEIAEMVAIGEVEALECLATNPLTRYLARSEVVTAVDVRLTAPRDHVHLDVDLEACVHCGLCAAVCATGGYLAVPRGDVVRKLHHYECTRDSACERLCPTGAIRLRIPGSPERDAPRDGRGGRRPSRIA